MPIKKKFVLALVGLIVSGCASGLPGTIEHQNKVKHSVELLSISELNELDQEYQGFSTKALTEAYLLKKILKWKDANNGLKMVKEIDFARQRHPDLFKTLMTANPDIFTFINGMSDVNAKKLQNDDFRSFLEGTDPFPAVPGNLSADNVSPFGFTAHWGAVDGANSYEIVLDSNAPVNVGNNLSYVFDDLSVTNHSFKVRAIKNNLNSNYSATFPVVLTTQQFIYVKANATGSNNGRSWANAYTSLQSALENAASGQEIWVAAGTYKPTTDLDRTKTFQLKSGVNIYGGFVGTETLRTQRNFNTNPVVLSGDLNSSNTANDGDSYHVVKGDNNTIIDGITVTFSYANGTAWPDNTGGGIYNYYSNPTLSNLIFIYNSANVGGAIYNYGSSPPISNTTFSINGASYGGAIYNYYYSAPNITNSKFLNNVAPGGFGGGIYNEYYSSPTISNTTFLNNTASYGGAIYNYSSSSTINSTIFSNNGAYYGGAIYNNYYSSPINVTNSIFSNNTSTYSGGSIYNSNTFLNVNNSTFNGNASSFGGGIFNDYSSVSVRNSIMWGNTATSSGASSYNYNNSFLLLGYSDIQNGISGITNFSTSTTKDILNTTVLDSSTFYTAGYNLASEPLFVNALDPDGIDNIFRTTDDGLALQGVSPAINTGTNTGSPETDIIGTNRPMGLNVDMGAYEFIPRIIYVNGSASGGNGNSWATAYNNLQSALSNAQSGDEIWVAAGTYKPGSQRADTFQLVSGVSVYGGFNGTESQLNQRNFVTNPTILSGDIDGQTDVYDQDIAGGIHHSNIAGNSYHVVTGASNATLDGLTIMGGNASNNGNAPADRGGGLYNNSPNLILKNIIFIGNSAFFAGGALYQASASANAVLDKVIFSGNVSIYGGGIQNFLGALTITNSVFTNNSGTQYGGGILNEGPLKVTNSTFSKNLPVQTASTGGGGIYKNNSVVPVLTNVLFYNSSIEEYLHPDNTTAIEPTTWGSGNVRSTIDIFTSIIFPSGNDGKWFTNDDGLRISSGSSIINPLTFGSSFPLTDILGNTRVSSPEPGAYEYLP